jgi:hypothetical protein
MDRIRKYGVNDLMNSITKNGFLLTDRIIVRPLSKNDYVIVEGNRRLAALRLIRKAYEEGDQEISRKLYDSIEQIQVLVYTGPREDASWTFQAIRHLAGVRDWPAFQKARVLYEKMKSSGTKNLAEVGEFYGISGSQIAVWTRAYSAYLQAHDDEQLGGRITPKSFPFLQELFNRNNCKNLREWMSWDAKTLRFKDEDRFRVFLGLFLESEEEPPRLSQAIELRELNKLLIENQTTFNWFVSDESLTLRDARKEIYRKEAESQTSLVTLDDYLEDLKEFAQRMVRIPIFENLDRKNDVIEICTKIKSEASRIIKQVQKL